MPTSQANKPVNKAIAPLSARLSAIAEGLPRGGVVCDVGSDHGALPLYLLQKGLCERAVVTDLNPLPLSRAQKALTEAGVHHKAEFVLTDGIAQVLSFQPDSFVIAGMGGETIAGILERAGERIPKNTLFALQPMSRSRFLRCYLYENGFCVEGERAVSENGKVFLIFFARYDGLPRPKSEDFYFLGEFLPASREAANKKYLQSLLASLQSKIVGKTKAGQCVETEKREEEQVLKLLEKFHENL